MSQHTVSLNVVMQNTAVPFCDQVADAVKQHTKEQRQGKLGASGAKEYHVSTPLGMAPVRVEWAFETQEA